MAIYKGYLQDKGGNILLPELARDFLVTDTLIAGEIKSKNILNITGISNPQYASFDNTTNKITLNTNHSGTSFLFGNVTELIFKAGQSYTFTIYLDALSTTSSRNLLLRIDGIDNEIVKSIYFNISSGSLVQSYTWIPNKDEVTGRIGFYGNNAGVTFRFQIEEGTKSTDYYPNFKIPSFDEIYPIGAIYLSIDSTNPTKLFGGAWQQIAQGRTLVGVDTSQIEFNTVQKVGGETTHKLTAKELPAGTAVGGTNNKSWAIAHWDNYSGYAYVMTTNDDSHNTTTGGASGQPHNNLQPYYTCYIWLRVA